MDLTNTHIQEPLAEEPKKNPPLWKQLAGAMAGMVVALALYHVFLGVKGMAASVLASDEPKVEQSVVNDGQTFTSPGVAPRKRIQPIE